MGDVVAVGLASLVFVALLASAEAATRRWTIEPEASRELVHLSSGVVAAGLPLVMSFPAIVVLALLFIPFMAVSRRIGLFPAVHGVERVTWGEGTSRSASWWPPPLSPTRCRTPTGSW